MSPSTEPHDRGGESATSLDNGPAAARWCRRPVGRHDGPPPLGRGLAVQAHGRRPISEPPDDFGEFPTLVARTAMCGETAPRYGALRVEDPGELIAALPAMVGFRPERSLVVAVIGVEGAHATPVIEAVVRFDLCEDVPDTDPIETFAGCVGQVCAVDDARQVLAVVVDDGLTEGPPTSLPGRAATADAGRAEAAALVAALERRLTGRGIDLVGAWATPAIAAGHPWWNLFDPHQHGRVPDPDASPVTVAHVVDGRPIHRTRAELVSLLAENTAGRAEFDACLNTAAGLARDRFAVAVRHGAVDRYRRAALEYVLWRVAEIDAGGALATPVLAEVVVALRDRCVRDSVFALAVGEHAWAAEQLWLTLTRASTGPDRADLAALLGYSAYIRGDGPFAGIALDAALEADPTNPMAILLETALRAGMRPETLRRLARSGHATAARLGVDLGGRPE
ncbi:DUF4192 domain-containing protein [Nocardia takedensis]|uniref:DUF4192 domain-containing protein n=1 Tax=Nocardia takedensis TaxID=259390 RepID=UPI00031D1AC5|nr:DUF4192 domain-containing protein [Nocardia takedensis]